MALRSLVVWRSSSTVAAHVEALLGKEAHSRASSSGAAGTASSPSVSSSPAASMSSPRSPSTLGVADDRSPAAIYTSKQYSLASFASAANNWQRPPEAQVLKNEKKRWEFLSKKDTGLNPCNSHLHPAARHAGVSPANDRNPSSVQSAYTPEGQCIGCGPSAKEGMHLQSYRSENGGLEATLAFEEKHQAFPGIVNSGAITTVMDCHGNWTAAMAIMDKDCVSRPPLTLTSELQMKFLAPVSCNSPMHLSSRVLKIADADASAGTRAAVTVEINMRTGAGEGKVLVQAKGVFKKMGAVRAM